MRGGILLSNEDIDSIINARVVHFETTGSAENLAQAPVMFPQSELNSITLPAPRPTDYELMVPGLLSHNLSHNATSIKEPETGIIAFHSNPTPTRGRINLFPPSRGGFGFTESGRDYFVHFSAVADYGFSTRREGAPVSFEDEEDLLNIRSQTRLPSEHGTASRMSIFRPETNNSLSAINKNEATLIEVGFSEDKLVSEEEKDTFRRYCCSISKRIMAEPVFDPRFPQFQFEKSEILRWLAIKQEHPFNRVKLTPNELTLNQSLKDEIDKFVNDIVLSHQQHTSSGSFSKK